MSRHETTEAAEKNSVFSKDLSIKEKNERQGACGGANNHFFNSLKINLFSVSSVVGF
jgi:hypothetical protein